MARNRMIKVDFWADEKIAKVSPLSRLLFIGIWNFCDDVGVCRATSGFLRSQIFQHDEIDLKKVASLLKELEEACLISIIEYYGESYLMVKNFLKHQKIDRPSKIKFIDLDRDKLVELFNSSSHRRVIVEPSSTNIKRSKVKLSISDFPEFDFEEVWRLYPIKKGKEAALKSFKRSVKTGDDFNNLKTAISNYSKECIEKHTEKKFIKHGSTFFNCWTEYLESDISPLEAEKNSILTKLENL